MSEERQPRPEIGSVWRKHFRGASHGARYTYEVRVVVGAVAPIVQWLRSDGLTGQASLTYWLELWTRA